MNNKELQLVTFEQAKKLKELGFDWIKNPCYKNGELTHEPVLTRKYKGIEDICFAAPPIALALKWFRDEKKYYIGIMPHSSEMSYYGLIGSLDTTERYDTYEAAESALLDELLNILEKEKTGYGTSKTV